MSIPITIRPVKYFYLLLVIGISLALRLILTTYVAPYPDRYIQADAVGYNQLAINLLSGNGFSRQTISPYIPDNLRTPLYPFTISLIYKVSGIQPSLVLMFQAFMGMLTTLCIYLVAKPLFGSRVGIIAATIYSISPISIIYTALLWSDTEFTLVLTVSLLFSIKMIEHQNIKWVLLSGLMFGIATLIHPRSLYLQFVVPIFLIIASIYSHNSIKRAFLLVGLFLLSFNLTLLPWRMRNYNQFGIPNLTSITAVNMLDYSAAITEASITGENQWVIAQRYKDEIRELYPGSLNEAEYAGLASKYALTKIAQHPISYLKVHILGMTRIFIPTTYNVNNLITGRNSFDTAKIYSILTTFLPNQQKVLGSYLGEFPLMVWAIIGFETLFLIIVYSFTLFTFIKLNRSSIIIWFLCAIIAYLTVISGPASTPRFKVAMMPIFSILAALGLYTIWQQIKLLLFGKYTSVFSK
jgi:4-amino-4-deoxy-L-arabinose transferase-like glycosyltransferase